MKIVLVILLALNFSQAQDSSVCEQNGRMRALYFCDKVVKNRFLFRWRNFCLRSIHHSSYFDPQIVEACGLVHLEESKDLYRCLKKIADHRFEDFMRDYLVKLSKDRPDLFPKTLEDYLESGHAATQQCLKGPSF